MDRMYLSVEVKIEDLADNVALDLSRNDLVEFIKAVDLRVAEVDFTDNLISELLESLRSDTNVDGSAIIDSIRGQLKKIEYL